MSKVSFTSFSSILIFIEKRRGVHLINSAKVLDRSFHPTDLPFLTYMLMTEEQNYELCHLNPVYKNNHFGVGSHVSHFLIDH